MDLWNELIVTGQQKSLASLVQFVEFHKLTRALSPTGECVLSIALSNFWSYATFDELIGLGCMVDEWYDREGGSLLHRAIELKIPSSIFRLIAQTMDHSTLYRFDYQSLTALHRCCINVGRIYQKYTLILVEQGISLHTTTNKDRFNALHLCIAANNQDLITVLTQNGTLINKTDIFQRTPLFYANDYQTLKYIVRSHRDQINFWQVDINGTTMLNFLCSRYSVNDYNLYRVVKLFYKHDVLEDSLCTSPLKNIRRVRALVFWAQLRKYVRTHKFFTEKNPFYLKTIAHKLGVSRINKLTHKSLYYIICSIVLQPDVLQQRYVNELSLTADKLHEIPSEFIFGVYENDKNYFFDLRNVIQMSPKNHYTQSYYDSLTLEQLRHRRYVLNTIGVDQTPNLDNVDLLSWRLEGVLDKNYIVNADIHRIQWFFEATRMSKNMNYIETSQSVCGLIELFLENSTSRELIRNLRTLIHVRQKYEHNILELQQRLELATKSAMEQVGHTEFMALCTLYHEDENIRQIIPHAHMLLLHSDVASSHLKKIHLIDALLILSRSGLVEAGRIIRSRVLFVSHDIICTQRIGTQIYK